MARPDLLAVTYYESVDRILPATRAALGPQETPDRVIAANSNIGMYGPPLLATLS